MSFRYMHVYLAHSSIFPSHSSISPSQSSSQRHLRPQPMPMPALESLYLEAVPTGHTPYTMDPVYNHGHQVKQSHVHLKKNYESRELLGKV